MTKTVSTSKKPRKQHSPEFRSEALKLAERIGVAAAARELSLYESQLYAWRSKLQQQMTSSERESELAAENARLKRQLAEQAEELAILQKAATYFAKRQLACDALQMAQWRRKRPRNVIVHSDRGSQYCSADYQALLKRHNLRGSMSAKGCCYDNACVESFFHSLKVECLHGEHFISREIMRATVFNYIECDYNRWRRHSWCGGLSPEQFENQNLA
ncbi:TPA: IS3 family transposase [Escherichia coli]|nr:IS3 family transposase [Escherichia coli]HAZ3680553.1 IS3 family transposase [Escherichia coli]HAZ3906538.1 IS3 family transposase [Escherichia coli]HBA7074383.1 IS3 family transposase [Escherichia coli]HBA7189230.1 IS3 family transposase [Escherichia coli]